MRLLLSIDKHFPKKSLGQNFISDKNYLEKISKKISSNINTTIIEIGPGKAALTNYLVKKKFKSLILIEKDIKLATELKLKFKNSTNITVHNEDALHKNYEYFKINTNTIIVGNLPFNISTQLLFKWLGSKTWPPFYSEMILMFQKEVAERILSSPNKKKYGKITVAAQSRCKVEKLMLAPAEIFSPKPKVDGIILRFKPILKYKNIDFVKLQQILDEAFRQRRKKIKSNLKNYLEILNKLQIDENLRAENLTVNDYCNLTKYI
tara:strand:- start:342 stop:1133 length:792 start_codon:yes stop_codon:yes gene_type:complete